MIYSEFVWSSAYQCARPQFVSTFGCSLAISLELFQTHRRPTSLRFFVTASSWISNWRALQEALSAFHVLISVFNLWFLCRAPKHSLVRWSSKRFWQLKALHWLNFSTSRHVQVFYLFSLPFQEHLCILNESSRFRSIFRNCISRVFDFNASPHYLGVQVRQSAASGRLSGEFPLATFPELLQHYWASSDWAVPRCRLCNPRWWMAFFIK